jgi:hypothetical protein
MVHHPCLTSQLLVGHVLQSPCGASGCHVHGDAAAAVLAARRIPRRVISLSPRYAGAAGFPPGCRGAHGTRGDGPMGMHPPPRAHLSDTQTAPNCGSAW